MGEGWGNRHAYGDRGSNLKLFHIICDCASGLAAQSSSPLVHRRVPPSSNFPILPPWLAASVKRGGESFYSSRPPLPCNVATRMASSCFFCFLLRRYPRFLLPPQCGVTSPSLHAQLRGLCQAFLVVLMRKRPVLGSILLRCARGLPARTPEATLPMAD